MKRQRSKSKNTAGLFNKVSEMVCKAATLVNAILPCFNILSLCSKPDYADNAKALYDYLERYSKRKLWIIWHVMNPREVKAVYRKQTTHTNIVFLVKKNRILSFLLFCLSRYVVDTHGLYSMVKLKNRQKSVYLTHGMPVKKFGFEYENDVLVGVQHADYALATSPYYQDVISRSMGIEKKNVFPIGLPRNDVFFEKENLGERINAHLSNRFILYLPTYRVANDRNKNNGRDLSMGDLLLGGSTEEWFTFNQTLEAKDTKVVIKPHPLEMHNNLDRLKNLSQIIVIDDDWIIQNGFSLNLIMKYSSALITDYSGAFVDYLLTDRPIIFYIPDYREYEDSRGYVFENFINMIPGEIVTEFSHLKDALGKDDFREKRAEIRKILNCQTAATASAEICSILFGNFYSTEA